MAGDENMDNNTLAPPSGFEELMNSKWSKMEKMKKQLELQVTRGEEKLQSLQQPATTQACSMEQKAAEKKELREFEAAYGQEGRRRREMEGVCPKSLTVEQRNEAIHLFAKEGGGAFKAVTNKVTYDQNGGFTGGQCRWCLKIIMGMGTIAAAGATLKLLLFWGIGVDTIIKLGYTLDASVTGCGTPIGGLSRFVVGKVTGAPTCAEIWLAIEATIARIYLLSSLTVGGAAALLKICDRFDKDGGKKRGNKHKRKGGSKRKRRRTKKKRRRRRRTRYRRKKRKRHTVKKRLGRKAGGTLA